MDPLLGPGPDGSMNRMNKAMERQQKHFSFQCTPRAFLCVGIFSVIDIALLITAFVLNGGWNPSSWWSNIDGRILIKMGAKDTALIQQGQIWRLFVAMFLHVGLLHCVLNILTQLALSVQIEARIGAIRTGFIYLISGLGGNLVSAIFLPNLPEVGASSSLFGLVAVYFVDLIVHWDLHVKARRNMIIMISTTIISFALGFFPNIDNFAHLGGFVTGLVASFIVMPNVHLPSFVPSKQRQQHRRNLLRILLSCFFLLLIFVPGIVILYSGLKLDHWCGFCETISCLPIFQVCKDLKTPHSGAPY